MENKHLPSDSTETFVPKKRVVDVVEGPNEEMMVFCADGTCVRVQGIPYTIRMELPLGSVWGDGDARDLANELNRKINPFQLYGENAKPSCRRQGCTCQHAQRIFYNPLQKFEENDEEDEEEEAAAKRKPEPKQQQQQQQQGGAFLNSAPCILKRYNDWTVLHAKRVVFPDSAHVEPGFPLNGYWETPRSYVKMRLTNHHFITDVQRELDRYIEKRRWPCEVAGVQNDAKTAFLYATVESAVDRAVKSGNPPPTQAFGIGSMRWITIPVSEPVVAANKITTCEKEYVVDFRDLIVDFDAANEEEESTQKPLKVMSFDIETFFDVKRKSSLCHRDPILTIAMSYGPESNPLEKIVCLTWGDEVDTTCALKAMMEVGIPNITEAEKAQLESITTAMENLVVVNLENEKEMLLEFARAIRDIDPDVFTGYNLVFFDMPYIFGRCEALKIDTEFMCGISRRINHRCSLTTGETFTNQSGGKRSFNADIPGRVFVDMLPFVRSKKQLREYKLDYVARELLKCPKLDMPYEEIGDHFHGGKIAKRKLVEYCVVDAMLAAKLMMLMETLNVVKSESKVFGVTLEQRVGRGLQMQLARIIEEFARPLLINLPKHARDKSTGNFRIPFHDLVQRLPPPRMRDLKVVDKKLVEIFEGDEVPKPKPSETTITTKRPKLVQSTLQFRALPTPSPSPPPPPPPPPPLKMEIEEEAEDEEEDDDADDSDSDGMPMRGNHGNQGNLSFAVPSASLKRGSSALSSSTSSSSTTTTTKTDKPKRKKKEKGYEGAWVFPIVADYYVDPVISLDFASLYPSEMREHNLCPTTLLPTVNDVPESKKTRSVMGYEFIRKDVRKGLLPLVLESLLHKRSVLKKQMKSHPKGSPKWTVLNGMQNAVKICANSIYGGCGATTSVLSCVYVAETVTAFGRQSIMKVYDLITARPSPYPFDLEVIGGDTDSTFVCVRKATLAQAMELGPKLEEAINKGELFGEELQIAFECVIYPSLFRAKKSAIGLKYESLTSKPEKMEKGWISVRRDHSLYVAKLASSHVDIILHLDLTKQQKAFQLEATTRRAIHALLKPHPSEKDVRGQRLFDDSLTDKKLIEEKRRSRVEHQEYRVPVSELTLTSNFTRPVDKYAFPERLPHIRAVMEWMKIDKTECPQLGDRIPYLLVHNRELGKVAKIGDSARAPFLVKPEDVNYKMYFDKLEKAVRPILKFFITDPRKLNAIFNVTEATMTDAYVRGFEEVKKEEEGK